jgi:hypothetical protein
MSRLLVAGLDFVGLAPRPQGHQATPTVREPSSAQGADAATTSILPMEIQRGDRFTDRESEWEIHCPSGSAWWT